MIKTLLLVLIIVYPPFSYMNARGRAIDNGVFFTQEHSSNGKCYANVYYYNPLTAFYPSDLYLYLTLQREETFITIFSKDGQEIVTTAWNWWSHGHSADDIIVWNGSSTSLRYTDQDGYQRLPIPNGQCED